jgi:hypothetical protein
LGSQGGFGIEVWNDYVVAIAPSGNISFYSISESSWAGSPCFPIRDGAVTFQSLVRDPATGAITIGALRKGEASPVIAASTQPPLTTNSAGEKCWNGISGVHTGYMIDSDADTGQRFGVSLQNGSGFADLPTVAPANISPEVLTEDPTGLVYLDDVWNYSTSGGWGATLTARTNGKLYIGTGPTVLEFQKEPYQEFDPTAPYTFSMNSIFLDLPQSERVIGLAEIGNLLAVATDSARIYTTDFTKNGWNVPVQCDEAIASIVTHLNTLYVFTNNKGRIYASNGYQMDLFAQLPQTVADNYPDPQILFGRADVLNEELIVPVIYTDDDSDVLYSAVAHINTLTQAVTFDETYSDLNPWTPTNAPSVIADYATNPFNSYYLFGNRGLEYNDEDRGEATIISPIYQIGTALTPTTFTHSEYQLDRPLTQGDRIRVYARPSLAPNSSWTLLQDISYSQDTGSKTHLSFPLQAMPFQEWDMIQFKIVIDGATTLYSVTIAQR